MLLARHSVDHPACMKQTFLVWQMAVYEASSFNGYLSGELELTGAL